MDLTKTISYNGWTSGATLTAGGLPAYGSQIEDATFSDAEVAGYTDKAALRDGIDAGDVYLGRRILNIRASVFGSSKGDGFDRLQSFLAAFSPRLAYNASSALLGFKGFDFYQPTANISTWTSSTYPNGIPMRFYCRPAALPVWSLKRDSTGGQSSNGIAFDVMVPMLMRDPRKYLQTQQSVSMTGSSQTATYRGDYSSFPIITFSLSATGGSNLILVAGDASATIDLSSMSSGSWTVNFEDGTVKTGSTSRFDLVTTFVAGEMRAGSVYIATGRTGVEGNYPTLTYREAWA